MNFGKKYYRYLFVGNFFLGILMKGNDDFDWHNELKLTGAFLFNRLMPILVYFVAFLLVLQWGTPTQIDSYSLYSSLFNTALAFGLSMVAAIRFYATQLSHRQLFLPMIKLALFMGLVVLLGFLIYAHYFLQHHLQNTTVALFFALSIPVAFCYEFLVAYGESKRVVKGSNYANRFSLLIFIAVFLLLYFIAVPYFLVLIEAVTVAYFLAEFLVLMILSWVIYRDNPFDDGVLSYQKISIAQSLKNVIFPIIIFSLPIIILQFLKRVSQSHALLSVSHIDNAAGTLQAIFMLSLICSIFAVAFSSNAFVVLAEQMRDWQSHSLKTIKRYNCYNVVLMGVFLLLLLLVMAVVYFLSIDYEHYLLLAIKNNPILIILFIFSDMLMWSAMMYARALGDSWRVQSLWILSFMAVFFGLDFYYQMDMVLSLLSFLWANVSGLVFTIFWVIFNIKNKISHQLSI